MPAPLSPQSLRGDARFDLDGIYELMVEGVSLADAIDEQLDHMVAHIKRRTSHMRRGYASMNRLRRQAVTSLDEADDHERDEERFHDSGLAVV